MTYLEAKRRLFEKTNPLRKLSLKNMKQAAKIFLKQPFPFLSIHVAGTNGKGSVSTKLAHILKLSGYSVGLFTSPHLVSFHERIMINNKQISKKDVARLLHALYNLEEQLNISLSLFESLTLLALKYFSEKQVDFAVIETGLGGRLDATNVINPILSVITSIGFDHMKQLGSDLESVAFEKGGIIKRKTPVVVGPSIKQAILSQLAEKRQTKLHRAPKTSGCFETENQSTALKAVEILKKRYNISNAAVEKGITTIPACRFEQTTIDGVPIIYDGAHNLTAFEKLFHKLELQYPNRKITLLFSLCLHKESSQCITFLKNHVSHFYLLNNRHDRLRQPKHLLDEFHGQNVQNCEITNLNLDELEKIVKQVKQSEGILLVSGSFYSMDWVKRRVKKIAEGRTPQLNSN